MIFRSDAMKTVLLAITGAAGLWVASVGLLLVWGAQVQKDGGYPHSGFCPDAPRWCERE